MNDIIDISNPQVQEKIVVCVLGSVLIILGSLNLPLLIPKPVLTHIGAAILTLGALLFIREVYAHSTDLA